jgi:hypothetical protein
MIRYSQPKAHAGDMIFRGENPPAGAIIDYYLGRADAQVALAVHDASGALVVALDAKKGRGLNRVVWNLRHPPVAAPARRAAADDEEGGGGGLPGPFVVPGTYTVRLTVDGRTHEQRVQVADDPRITVAPAARAEWTATLLRLGEMHRSASVLVDGARSAGAQGDVARERLRVTRELQSRIASLYRAVSASTGPLTSDQRQQMTFFDETRSRLAAQVSAGANR